MTAQFKFKMGQDVIYQDSQAGNFGLRGIAHGKSVTATVIGYYEMSSGAPCYQVQINGRRSYINAAEFELRKV